VVSGRTREDGGNQAGRLAVTGLLVSGPAFATLTSTNELAEMRAAVDGMISRRSTAQQEQASSIRNGLLQMRRKWCASSSSRTSPGHSRVSVSSGRRIDVNMSVGRSYAYNFNQPNEHSPGHFRRGPKPGDRRVFYPFHGDHNSFQVDQVWLDIGKKVTDESRAGFMFSILYGNNASFDAQGFNSHPRRDVNDSTSDYYVAQAFVKYLAPVGEGVEFDLGKFETLLGAEVVDASKNWNITRGNEWTLLQSIDHLGLLTSTTVGSDRPGSRNREFEQRPRELARHQLGEELPRQDRLRSEGTVPSASPPTSCMARKGPRASLDSASPGP